MPFLTDFCQIVKLYYVILFVIEFYFYCSIFPDFIHFSRFSSIQSSKIPSELTIFHTNVQKISFLYTNL